MERREFLKTMSMSTLGAGLGYCGIRTEQYTMWATKTKGKPVEHFLFDRLKDPYQMDNIAPREPALLNKLTGEELIPWLAKAHPRPPAFKLRFSIRTIDILFSMFYSGFYYGSQRSNIINYF